jgi:hypothetical protein
VVVHGEGSPSGLVMRTTCGTGDKSAGVDRAAGEVLIPGCPPTALLGQPLHAIPDGAWQREPRSRKRSPSVRRGQQEAFLAAGALACRRFGRPGVLVAPPRHDGRGAEGVCVEGPALAACTVCACSGQPYSQTARMRAPAWQRHGMVVLLISSLVVASRLVSSRLVSRASPLLSGVRRESECEWCLRVIPASPLRLANERHG